MKVNENAILKLGHVRNSILILAFILCALAIVDLIVEMK